MTGNIRYRERKGMGRTYSGHALSAPANASSRVSSN